MFLILLIFILNIADAVLTLHLISLEKIVEANPVMDFFLKRGPVEFLFAKFGLIIPTLLFLYIGLKNKELKNFTEKACYAILGVYTTVVIMNLTIMIRFT